MKNTRSNHRTFAVATLLCLAALACGAAEVTQKDWGAPNVRVEESEGKWLIVGAQNRVELNPADLQMTIQAAGEASGLSVILHDESGWPSGQAGGKSDATFCARERQIYNYYKKAAFSLTA